MYLSKICLSFYMCTYWHKTTGVAWAGSNITEAGGMGRADILSKENTFFSFKTSRLVMSYLNQVTIQN